MKLFLQYFSHVAEFLMNVMLALIIIGGSIGLHDAYAKSDYPTAAWALIMVLWAFVSLFHYFRQSVRMENDIRQFNQTMTDVRNFSRSMRDTKTVDNEKEDFTSPVK